MLGTPLVAFLVALLPQVTTLPVRAPRPNVVLVLADDLGYGDLSCAGHPTIHTPRLDALARDGRRFTQFVLASSVCTPSRAALLTGCYPKRVGLHEHVVFPADDHGLHPDEVTLAEVLRAAGYTTGAFGKWHLGHRRGLLPTDQGFDTWFGIPYSNDMAQQHRPVPNGYAFRLPLLRDTEVIEWEPDQRLLTQRCTAEAIAFIERHVAECEAAQGASRDKPFFVYLAHPMPHVPLFASEAFEGTSPRGLYGDVIEEFDASVGALVDALEALGLTNDTLLLFTSDNGPWTTQGLRGGSAGPLRGGKSTAFEGGHRVPLIARWPGHVPAGTLTRELVTALDWLPTLAKLAGAEVTPPNDGHDIGGLLGGAADARSPTDEFLYYAAQGPLAGIRRGPWKLLLGETPAEDTLYQLERDVSEQHDVAARHPDLARELRERALARDAEITAHARPVGRSAESVFDPRKE